MIPITGWLPEPVDWVTVVAIFAATLLGFGRSKSVLSVYVVLPADLRLVVGFKLDVGKSRLKASSLLVNKVESSEIHDLHFAFSDRHRHHFSHLYIATAAIQNWER
jgi:hypothetical protein